MAKESAPMLHISRTFLIAFAAMPAVSAPLESLDTPSLTQFAHATQALKSALTKPLIDAITYELSFLDRTLARWKKQDALIAPLLTDVPPYRELPADSPYFFNRFTQNTAEKIEGAGVDK